MISNKSFTIIKALFICFVCCSFLFNNNAKAAEKQAQYSIDLSKCMEALNDKDKDASDRSRYCLKSLKSQSKEFNKLFKEKEIAEPEYIGLKKELDQKIKKVEELELKYNKAIGSILFEVPGADYRMTSSPTSGAQLYYAKTKMLNTKEKQDKIIKQIEMEQENSNKTTED